MGELKHVENRIIVKVDVDGKNWHTFSDGTEIRLERNTDNFDLKYVAQNIGVVIDAENIPKDAIILMHHNATHDTYLVDNHSNLSGEEIASGIKIYSIMERDCFFWKMPHEEEWHPTKEYATALRVFKPYIGILEGVKPTLIKDTLWVTSGKYKNQVVKTIEASDYCITFRDPTTGKDKSIIRFRPDGIESEQREAEAIAVMNELTDGVNNGSILVGLTVSDCAPFHVELL